MAQTNTGSATQAKAWEKRGWRAYPRVQMPDYPDAAALAAVEAQLGKYPPLVFAGEARRLKQSLGRTWQRRPELLAGRCLSKEETQLLGEFQEQCGQETIKEH